MPSLWKVVGMKDAPNNKVAAKEKENKSKKKRSKVMVFFFVLAQSYMYIYIPNPISFLPVHIPILGFLEII